MTTIDHIIVTAPDLASGAELVRRALGVDPQPGGKHVRLGTHNLVLKLGDSVYLEVIAPDPDAADPGRPRWFELDDRRPPRLAGWAARTTDIRVTAAAASEPLGTITEMSRGDLNWLITVPDDGKLPLGGAGPALIEWRAPHPAAKMRDTGCSLAGFDVFHPDDRRVAALYQSIEMRDGIQVSAAGNPHLVARFHTPAGPRSLGGP